MGAGIVAADAWVVEAEEAASAAGMDSSVVGNAEGGTGEEEEARSWVGSDTLGRVVERACYEAMASRAYPFVSQEA